MIDAKAAADVLHLNIKRIQQLARLGRLPARRHGRKWLFERSDLERMLGGAAPAPQPQLEMSARNQLRARVSRIVFDGLMAEVTLALGDQEMVSIITRSSAERLGLAVGREVVAVVKSTEVMIGAMAVAGNVNR
jgi:molybdopterin-binding protein